MKTNMKIGVSMVVLLFATGCITPRYKSPSIDTAAAYRNAPVVDSATLAKINWRDYYTDTKLQLLIYEAIDSNLNLRVALKQIEEAQAYFKKSKASLAPVFTAGAQYAANSPSDNGPSAVPASVDKPLSDYNLNVSASWEIDIWGKIRSAKKAALADLLMQQATKDAIVTQLVSDVATAYYQLLMLDAQKRITEETVVNYTVYLEKVKTMKNSARTNDVAVQQAYAQLYGAKAYLPELTAAIEVTENYLSLLMGKSGGPIDRADDFNLHAITSSIPVGLSAQLLQYRPDLIAAEQALRASHERFNMARASMYPALTLSGSVGIESLKAKTWFTPESLFWNAVAGLTQPLFNARTLRTQKEVNKLKNEESYLVFRQKTLAAVNEVSNALLQCGKTAEKAEYQKLQSEALAKAYDQSQKLFLSDYATYLDVLVAQNSLFSTQLSLYDTYFSVIRQKIELYRALGGGWQ